MGWISYGKIVADVAIRRFLTEVFTRGGIWLPRKPVPKGCWMKRQIAR